MNEISTYNVFRAENRAEGHCEWIGDVQAESAEEAQAEAEATMECRQTCHLFVREVESDDA